MARLDNLAFLGTDMPVAVKEDKTLARSGLLFAGANTALKGLPLPDGVDDGVLTAKEISGMDLRNLDMVALWLAKQDWVRLLATACSVCSVVSRNPERTLC